MANFTSLEQVVNTLRTQLATNDRVAVNGLKRIYEYQTADEKASGNVTHFNGVGFTGSDAGFLSSLARQASYKMLSQKQLAILHKKMPKYARQLVNQSIAKGLIKKVGNEYVW